MMSVWLVSNEKGKLALAPVAHSRFGGWNSPKLVRAWCREIECEIRRQRGSFYDEMTDVAPIHQHASFQSFKEIQSAAAFAEVIGSLAVRLCRDTRPDAEVLNVGQNASNFSKERLEITTAEEVNRNPSCDEIHNGDGLIEEKYLSLESMASAIHRVSSKKALLDYDQHSTSLLIYLNGFWPHPEDKLNKTYFTEAAAPAASKFKKVYVLGDGVRRLFTSGTPSYRWWPPSEGQW